MSRHDTTYLTSLQREILCGLTAGSLTTLIVHPLDLLKVRVQLLASNKTIHNKGYLFIIKDLIHTAKIHHNRNKFWENLIKESYRGLPINLIGNTVAWGLYFGLYNHSKSYIFDNWHKINPSSDKKEPNKSSVFLVSGLFSGVMTTLLTNPLWVIKTRIMSTSKTNSHSYTSIMNGFKSIMKEEGPRALWKGLVPSLFGVSQGALYFMVYDNLKLKFNIYNDKNNHYEQEKSRLRKKTENYKIIFITSISKMISVSAVYPFQLLKANLQIIKSLHNTNNNRNSSTVTTKVHNERFLTLTKQIYKDNGFKGLYKGLLANLIRAVPSTCITFCIYENLKAFL
ncbi:flavin adenine dinucleotide transporter FLX1 NDAI_0B03890 [Naumovozyma dairenensis CBS 421]|uniref:Uncharacterized protein n=1 Tax=Naumovozyma dairenensis (strain ATCC 10597 / BCRC 20456 / CBS 421 / NBRC 0211 / NRRL Y-12639) TaxID=1071378 RepID=G0W6L2_NAUDC|nr:hypothetical protein NDAI_0B03890 [Naumovozyma dairenensis CBS 421]CCD23423.1 hypothetical protein NDAI_0B03890 [Naumovozyma dairenensis CBS 421]